MAIIDGISQMRQQGFTESQIIQSLRERGVSPREILEAIEQSKVKSAVSDNTYGAGGMQPSMMSSQPEDIQDVMSSPPYQPMTQEIPSPGQQAIYPQAQYPAEQGYQEYSQYPAQAQQSQQYPAYQQYPQQSMQVDTETISDLASQIVEEKIERVRSQILSLEKSSIESQNRILSVDDRLKRIEIIIDRLQTAILGKIGEYWKELSEIKDELRATQGSFSKMISPHPSAQIHRPAEKEKPRADERRGKPKSKAGFENYLRE